MVSTHQVGTIEIPRNAIFFGYTADEAYSKFLSLYELGIQNKASYLFDIRPYDNNATQDLPLFHDGWTAFLASSVEFPVAGLSFDQKKVAGMNINHLTDLNFPQFTVNFLETSDARFLNSLKAYREFAVNNDGTVNEPANYAFEVRLLMYDYRLGVTLESYTDRFICSMSMETIQDLSAKDPTALEVPIIFHVLDPYM